MRFWVALLLVVGVLGSVHAQPTASVAVSASARPAEVGPNGRVTVVLRVEGASLADIETPEPPATSNLVLQRSTPSTRQTRSSTGRRSVVFRWTYRPLRTGVARIRPVDVTVRGKTYTTGDIRVQVVPSSQLDAAPRTSGPASGGAGGVAAAPDAARLGPRAIFIRGRPSADQVYRNEQVTVEYRLFFRPQVRLRRSRMAGAWDAPGFWREELNVSPRPVPTDERAFGATYNTIVLKRVALFPTRPGTLHVEPLRIETEAQGAGRVARGRYESVTLSSDRLAVTVRPLPPGAPPAFDGAVGQFALTARTAGDSVRVGRGVEWTVQVRGVGNLSTVSPPVLPSLDTFDVYGPRTETDLDRSGSAVQGTKTFTYTLVPRTPGRHRVPPAELAVFDPEARRYETFRTDPVVLRATGRAEPRATSRTGKGMPVGDIAGPMTHPGRWTRPDAPPLYRRPWPYVVLAVLVLGTVGGVAYRRHTGRDADAAPTPTDTVSPDALAAAQDHLRAARKHDEDPRALYRAVEKSLRAFLRARLGVDPGAPNAQVDERLAHPSVPTADREALHDLLDTCDRVQFAGHTPPDRPQTVLDRTRALLRRLDDALPDAPSSNA